MKGKVVIVLEGTQLKYTVWEQTPMKWHMFMVYFVAPVSLFVSAMQAAKALLALGEESTLFWAYIIDAAYFCIRVVVSFGAFWCGRPKRRRWWGPICTVSLYAMAGIYGLYNIFLVFYFEVPEIDTTQIGIVSVFTIVIAFFTYLYYNKRRCIFYQKKTKKSMKAEPENSVELLAYLMEQKEEKQVLNKNKKWSAAFWILAVIAIIICSASSAVAVINYN